MRHYAIDLDEALRRTGDALRRHRLLLLSDKVLPSLVTTVVGAPVAGSWWAHPLCHEIYMVSQRLQDEPGVAMLKLVRGKTTFVHRALWPALLAVGSAGGAWQTEGLAGSALDLLGEVRGAGCARVDRLGGARPRRDVARDAKALEARLLVFGDEVHTERGAHVKQIETWEHWARRVGLTAGEAPTPPEGRAAIDEACAAMARGCGEAATTPWGGGARARR
ncbi:MAG: hypothetical protein ACHP84_20550 [Caulobacterales bacterium]